MVQFVIYRNPSDFPDRFVVRRWYVVQGELQPRCDAIACVCSSLAEARKSVAPGLTCIHRDPNDDPVICEVWL